MKRFKELPVKNKLSIHATGKANLLDELAVLSRVKTTAKPLGRRTTHSWKPCYAKVRQRFLDIFKRDQRGEPNKSLKHTAPGNRAAHDGDGALKVSMEEIEWWSKDDIFTVTTPRITAPLGKPSFSNPPHRISPCSTHTTLPHSAYRNTLLSAPAPYDRMAYLSAAYRKPSNPTTKGPKRPETGLENSRT